MLRNRRFDVLLISLLVWCVSNAVAQGPSQPNSDPAALALWSQFVSSNVGSARIESFRANGTVFNILGDTSEPAAAKFESLGPKQARADFAFANGTRTEVRGVDASGAQTGYLAVNGTISPVASQNLYLGINWFLPVLSPLAQISDPQLKFEYLGVAPWGGANTSHVRVTRELVYRSRSTKNSKNTYITDFYLDPSTLLLVGMACVLHPDDGSAAPIPWEVHYRKYRKFEGVMVPTEIDQYLNGTRVLSVIINAAEINPPLSAADFQVEQGEN